MKKKTKKEFNGPFEMILKQFKKLLE